MLARKELLGPVGERGLSGSSYTGGGIAALEEGARGLDSSSYGNDATAGKNRHIWVFFSKILINYEKVLHINPNQKNVSFAHVVLTSSHLPLSLSETTSELFWVFHIGCRFPQLYNAFIKLLLNGEKKL